MFDQMEYTIARIDGGGWLVYEMMTYEVLES